jgi:hypothetical protein
MNLHSKIVAALALLSAALSTGCATAPGYDYTAFKQSRPKSILVLPPVNNSNDVSGSGSLWSLTTLPLGESGYYVFPTVLVDETFRQNGLNNPAEVAAVPPAKLRQIFGADSALYITIKNYGTNYIIINSSTVVTADAKLVDLRNGALLWQGTATADSSETSDRSSGGGIVGMLIAAVINQVMDSATDASHKVASLTAARLLSASPPAGLLYGPRSPNYNNQ